MSNPYFISFVAPVYRIVIMLNNNFTAYINGEVNVAWYKAELGEVFFSGNSFSLSSIALLPLLSCYSIATPLLSCSPATSPRNLLPAQQLSTNWKLIHCVHPQAVTTQQDPHELFTVVTHAHLQFATGKPLSSVNRCTPTNNKKISIGVFHYNL